MEVLRLLLTSRDADKIDLVTASCKTEAILGRRYQKPDMPVGTWQTEVASEIKTI